MDPHWKNFVALRDVLRHELDTKFKIEDVYNGGGGDPHIELYLKWWTDRYVFTIMFRPIKCELTVANIGYFAIFTSQRSDHKSDHHYANPNFIADIIHDLGEYLPRMY